MLLLRCHCKELVWVEETIEKWVVFFTAVSYNCSARSRAKFLPQKL